MFTALDCNSTIGLACFVGNSFVSYINLQVMVDSIIWLWAHSALVFAYLEARTFWRGVKFWTVIDCLLGAIPFTLLIFNVTLPLLLLALSAYFKSKPIWEWYLANYALLPILGEGRYFERYFNSIFSVML